VWPSRWQDDFFRCPVSSSPKRSDPTQKYEKWEVDRFRSECRYHGSGRSGSDLTIFRRLGVGAVALTWAVGPQRIGENSMHSVEQRLEVEE